MNSRNRCGFILAVPDTVHAERGWFVVLLLAVLPEYRQSGVGTWLVAAAHQAARRIGHTAGVHAMVRVDEPTAISRLALKGEIIRRYALLEKSLD